MDELESKSVLKLARIRNIVKSFLKNRGKSAFINKTMSPIEIDTSVVYMPHRILKRTKASI